MCQIGPKEIDKQNNFKIYSLLNIFRDWNSLVRAPQVDGGCAALRNVLVGLHQIGNKEGISDALY